MQEHVISVTAAARRFADCVNRVRYQGVSFVLQKNGIPVARIVPVDSSSGAQLEQLAVALREARKSALFIEEDAIEEQAAAPPHEPIEPPESPPPPSPPKRSLLNW
jgi:prevent-host-death family protein